MGRTSSAALVLALFLGACSGDRSAELARDAGGNQTSASTTPSTTSTTSSRPLPPGAPTAPVAPSSPEGLAAQLTQVEAAIRNAATPATDLPHLGHTQQVAYRALAAHPEWQADTVARIPAELRPAVEANLLAVSELRVLASSEPRELPKWRIVAPPPAAELAALYRAAEATSGVPWQYLAAINLVETRMGRIRGDSSAGAQGPMQFIPTTWAVYGNGGDINAYPDAIHAAARLLKANGAPSNMSAALYAYNPSNRYVRAVTAYAEQMKANERAYLGYYHWQVYYFDTWLPEGFVG